jgi:hypothetical protein
MWFGGYMPLRMGLALGLALSAATIQVRAQSPVAFWELLQDQRLKLSLAPENQPQMKGGLLAWVDKDSLRFAHVDRFYPTGICSNDAVVQVLPLATLPLPNPRPAAPPAFGLLMGNAHQSGTTGIRATIAIALPAGTIHRYELTMPNSVSKAWTILKRDSLGMALGAGERPTLLVPFADASEENDSAMIISGTGGLLRTVNRTPAGLTQLASFPFREEELVSFGGRLFGGAKGGIYRWGTGSPPLVRLARPFEVPVRIVDSSGALGDEGWAALRLATGWHGYPLEPGRFRGFKANRDSGLGIWRYPDTGAPVLSRLRDTPSRIPAFTSGLGKFDGGDGGTVDGLGYSATLGTVTVKVPLEDSESTYSPPGVSLIGTDTLPMTPGFIRSGPPIGCAGMWGRCVQDDAAFIGLALSADSVILTMKVQSSWFVFAGGCSDNGFRRDSLYRMAAPWKDGQRLEIRLDGDLLTLRYEGIMGLIPDRRRGSLRQESAVYDILGRGFRARKRDGGRSPAAGVRFSGE